MSVTRVPPGPWSVEVARDRTLFVRGTYRIARITGSTAIGKERKRFEATASLLAAAPDLLAAAQETLATIQAWMSDYTPTLEDMDSARAVLGGAIEKAKGKRP